MTLLTFVGIKFQGLAIFEIYILSLIKIQWYKFAMKEY